MRQKIKKGKLEACKLSSGKNVLLPKRGFRINVRERIVQECIKTKRRYVVLGNAVDYAFCINRTVRGRLERGTLVGYEKFFHREFNITAQQESIIYWSEEQKGWRRFMIGNLMEWKAIV